MPYYSDDLVEEVRERSDIVEVISQYVHLTRKGSRYFGLCPFHNEKTASFSVSPDKQMYYCFGCGAGGNVFTFLMEYENFTFREAMEALAERAGVELPRQGYSEKQRKEADRRTRLLEIHKEAARYYYVLLRNARGKRALEYFRKRELSDATMNKFGLGYSDQYSDNLYRYLRKKGYEDEILKDTGLVAIDGHGGTHDRFWNRAMFPIMDIHNKVIGFGGRVMGDGKPKYLNSPETPIFDKSHNLYGLNLARSTKKPQLLLCEGYMDVIALHQAGFDNAVASLGTALTSGHAGLLKRYTGEVYLTYDSDGAGVKAALRAIPILKEAGISTKIVDMQPYKDPDEFIKALGAAAYQERIDHAENSFLFEIRMLEKQYDMQDPDGKTAFYNEAAKKLCGFSEKLERDNYIEAVASKYRIAVEDLARLVSQQGLRIGLASGTGYAGGQGRWEMHGLGTRGRQPYGVSEGYGTRPGMSAGKGASRVGVASGDARFPGMQEISYKAGASAGSGPADERGISRFDGPADGRGPFRVGVASPSMQEVSYKEGASVDAVLSAGQGVSYDGGVSRGNRASVETGLSGGTEASDGSEAEAGSFGMQGLPGGEGHRPTGARGSRAGKQRKDSGFLQSQKLLLTWLSEDTALFGKVEKYITPEDFTEDIYRKAAEMLFAQYREDGAVSPAKIVSAFEESGEQREIAGLFHATIHETLTKEDREKALTETVARVKENSINYRSKMLSPTDLEGLMKLLEEKKALEALQKMHISLD